MKQGKQNDLITGGDNDNDVNDHDDDHNIANDNHSINATISNTHATVTEEQIERHKASNKFILFQAFSYIGAFLITLIFPLLIISSDYIAKGPDYETFRYVVRILQLVFQPMQGFFNLLIFLSSKVYQQLNFDRNQTKMDILKKIFKRHYDDPIFLSKLSIVQNSSNQLELKIFLDDEEDSNEDEHDARDNIEDNVDSFVENISYPSNISPNMGDISYDVSAASPGSGLSHNSPNSGGISSWGNGRSEVSSTGLSHCVDSNDLSQEERSGHQANQITQSGNNVNTNTFILKRRSRLYQ